VTLQAKAAALRMETDRQAYVERKRSMADSQVHPYLFTPS
jgi:hypothetical protein